MYWNRMYLNVFALEWRVGSILFKRPLCLENKTRMEPLIKIDVDFAYELSQEEHDE